MTEVVSIRFKSRGKVYYFDPAGLQVESGDSVIVETSKGLELGDCSVGNHYVNDDKIVPPLRPVVRIATREDISISERNKRKEADAFNICQKKILEHGLDMKLVDVEYSFEGSKILFFFTSDGRVDFRELVKDLASVFKTRIELRQIGVRDEAKMIGGLGICGRPFCCSQFLDDFQPVSTKMAKTQSMSLNPAKISGSCGRLMCCLRYEQEAYEELIKTVPKSGAFVETPAGYGNVTQVNLLRQRVKVHIDGQGEPLIKSYDVSEIAVIPGGRPKPGEPLPSLLEPAILESRKKLQEDPAGGEADFAGGEKAARPQERPEGAPPKKKSPPRRRSRGKGRPAGQAAGAEQDKSGQREKPRATHGKEQQSKPDKFQARPPAAKADHRKAVTGKAESGSEAPKKSSRSRRKRRYVKNKPQADGESQAPAK